MPNAYSISQVSALLKLPEHKIHYAHRCGKLEEPSSRFTGRRAYDAWDIRRVAEHFGVEVPDKILEQEQDARERAARLEWAERSGLFTEEGQARFQELGRTLGILKD